MEWRNISLYQGFYKRFRQEGSWFSQAGKTFGTELLYKKIFPLDGQTRWTKSPQPVNLSGDWPLMNSCFIHPTPLRFALVKFPLVYFACNLTELKELVGGKS